MIGVSFFPPISTMLKHLSSGSWSDFYSFSLRSRQQQKRIVRMCGYLHLCEFRNVSLFNEEMNCLCYCTVARRVHTHALVCAEWKTMEISLIKCSSRFILCELNVKPFFTDSCQLIAWFCSQHSICRSRWMHTVVKYALKIGVVIK